MRLRSGSTSTQTIYVSTTPVTHNRPQSNDADASQCSSEANERPAEKSIEQAWSRFECGGQAKNLLPNDVVRNRKTVRRSTTTTVSLFK